jgi:hypothetical protein
MRDRPIQKTLGWILCGIGIGYFALFAMVVVVLPSWVPYIAVPISLAVALCFIVLGWIFMDSGSVLEGLLWSLCAVTLVAMLFLILPRLMPLLRRHGMVRIVSYVLIMSPTVLLIFLLIALAIKRIRLKRR